MAKEIINPETKYYVFSTKHTGKKDKYMTLWRPKNAGYCWPINSAGEYDGYEKGYHLSDGNVPIPISEIPKVFYVVDSEGRTCIKNSKASQAFVLEYHKS